MDAAFPPTRWSLIQRARGGLEGESRAAFDELCGAYWYPLFAFLRRSGTEASEAADLVQGLFVSLLERGSLDGFDEEGARFRSWLLVVLRNHARDAHARASAQKRGGDVVQFSLDVEGAEERYSKEGDGDPAQVFERAWAQEVLRRARRRLEDEYASSNRSTLFGLIAPTLDGEEVDRTGVERAMNMTSVALRVAIHRLRGRYREHLVEEVRDTLGPDEEAGAELNALLEALA